MASPALTEEFVRWTRNRRVVSFGSNDGADPLPYQTWHKFKEAFPPELVAHAIHHSGVEVKRCLDPFGGNGTTALTARMLGIESTTIEVNPFFVDVIKAKLHRYDVDALVEDLAIVRRRSRALKVEPNEYFHQTPATFLQPGVAGRWLFNAEIAERLGALLTAIDELDREDHIRFFRVMVGGMLMEVSNARTSGKGRRYRSNWNAQRPNPAAVEKAFAERSQTAILDVQEYSPRSEIVSEVIRGDARAISLSQQYDISVFSPPYPNSFDYTDVYNLELWMLGYLTDSTANRTLRTSTLSSHVQLMREYSPAPTGSTTLDRTIKELNQTRDSLWNRWIPAMVGAYFADMLSVLSRIGDQLVAGGQCWIVVGDSSYAGITVPVADTLAQLLESREWTLHRNESIRAMRSSVQQGWRSTLNESLLVVSPPA